MAERALINAKGLCPHCLIKPLSYKRPVHLFCRRCDRAFNVDTGEQIPNWAWSSPDGNLTFLPTYPKGA